MQEYLHLNSEHIIDWFHITMRLTVLQQQSKAVLAEQPAGDGVSKQIDSVKHLLWHGNVDEGLERLGRLFLDLDDAKMFGTSGQAGDGHRRIRDLHSQQPRIHL